MLKDLNFHFKIIFSSLVVQQVKDPELSVQQLGLLLCCDTGLIPGLGASNAVGIGQKKKKIIFIPTFLRSTLHIDYSVVVLPYEILFIIHLKHYPLTKRWGIFLSSF